ncbi:MAG: ZIP family metal transporter [Halolamina sp.]|uniref:ZIP family metal transporter n=1 Tax=Halolamina sp. TaxID=1940283 RepID=UPI002FC2C9DC
MHTHGSSADGGGRTVDQRREWLTGLSGVVLLLAATVLAVAVGAWKLIGIGWVAFLSMGAAAAVGARTGSREPTALVWGSGLASGAMVTSAALFLLPDAIGHHPAFGGLGVAVGILGGFSAHAIGHRVTHVGLGVDTTVAQLTAHAAAAGAIIGIVYGNMPELGPLLGVAIVSHKGPAGYAAADRLSRKGRSWLPILVPAAGVGVVAVLSSVVALPASPALRGLVFGFATGVFLHVAMDFLPRCELGSEVHDALAVEGDAHALLDRLRLHAVGSTVLGGLVVVLAWTVVQ